MKQEIEVVIDRPIGYQHHGTIYPINYGYVEGIIGGDGEEQDVYILGVDEPLSHYKAPIIAIIHRHDDNETKWVVSKKVYTKEEIYQQVSFIEQYFDSYVEVL